MPTPCTGPSFAKAAARPWARSAVRLAMTTSAGSRANSGAITPRAAPPAPTIRIRLRMMTSPRLSQRSRTSPAPSVLSPRMVPSFCIDSLQTASAECEELAHARLKLLRREVVQAIAHGLPGLAGKQAMDEGGPTVGHGVTHHSIQIAHELKLSHESILPSR